MDLLVVAIAVKAAPQRAYLTALMAVLGSFGGNLVLFLGARHGMRRLIGGLDQPSKGRRFRRWFDRYGLLTVFIPAVTPIFPLPLKVFVILAAVLHAPFPRFLAVILVARVIRYFGLALLAVHLGGDAQAFLFRHSALLLGIAVAVTVLLLFLVRRNERNNSGV
jgi:membrane protein YqaA with SNARE-associated domain